MSVFDLSTLQSLFAVRMDALPLRQPNVEWLRMVCWAPDLLICALACNTELLRIVYGADGALKLEYVGFLAESERVSNGCVEVGTVRGAPRLMAAVMGGVMLRTIEGFTPKVINGIRLPQQFTFGSINVPSSAALFVRCPSPEGGCFMSDGRLVSFQKGEKWLNVFKGTAHSARSDSEDNTEVIPLRGHTAAVSCVVPA